MLLCYARLPPCLQDIRYVYNFLQVLNDKLSKLVSLCLFIFIQSVLSSE